MSDIKQSNKLTIENKIGKGSEPLPRNIDNSLSAVQNSDFYINLWRNYGRYLDYEECLRVSFLTDAFVSLLVLLIFRFLILVAAEVGWLLFYPHLAR